MCLLVSDLINELKVQNSLKVNYLYFDNSGENMVIEKVLVDKKLKTKVEFTEPYTTQQNFMVEQTFTYILSNVCETLNTINIKGFSRPKFWEDCVNCMTHLEVIQVNYENKFPYELFYKRKPKLINKLVHWGNIFIVKDIYDNIKSKLCNIGTEAMFVVFCYHHPEGTFFESKQQTSHPLKKL